MGRRALLRELVRLSRGLSASTSRDADVFVSREYQHAIGNTPMAALRDMPGLYAKLEGHNPGHSIKDRTITSIVTGMLNDGALVPGSSSGGSNTLVLVTSGSAGGSLMKLHKELTVDVNIIIVMPSVYAAKKCPSQVIEKCSLDEPGDAWARAPATEKNRARTDEARDRMGKVNASEAPARSDFPKLDHSHRGAVNRQFSNH